MPTRRNPNSIAKEFHRERLADDAHVRGHARRQAKRWAYGMIADLASADLNAGFVPEESEPDRELKQKAMEAVIKELRSRATDL